MNVLSRPQSLTSLLMGRLGNALLWLLALVHVAALAILFLTLFSLTEASAAQQPIVCAGTDLRIDMQKNDPAGYAAAIAEAEKTPNSKGTFWKIEKPGTEPSWLLGTMHVSDPRIVEMPEGAANAFARADTIIIESDEITDQQKAMASIMAHPELTMFLDGQSITDMLSKDDVAKLEAGLQQRGIPLSAVVKMKPWMLASFVVLPACEFARKAKGAQFLDMQLASDAVAQGKNLVGLETIEEQITAVSKIPMSFQIQSLIQTVQLGDRMEDVMATMIELYLEGDVGLIMPLLKSFTVQSHPSSDEGYAAFQQLVIDNRNHVMADGAASHLDKGNVFMAVGALHLPGETGVIELLRAKGFTITAVR